MERRMFSLIVLALTLSHHVKAQTTTAMPAVATQGFEISEVPTASLNNWCVAQRNTCNQICYQATSTDTCDTSTLKYSCVCTNGTIPDVTAFVQTVPYYICQTTYTQCLAAHANDLSGQQQCAANEQCGTRDAAAEYSAYQAAGGGTVKSSSSSSTTASSTPSAISSSTTPRSSSSTTSSTSSSFTTSIASTSSSVSSAALSASSVNSSTASVTSSSGTSAGAAATATSSHGSPGLSAGAGAGIGVGAAVIVAAIAIAAFLTLRRRKAKKAAATRDTANLNPSSSFSDHPEKPELLGTLGTKSPSYQTNAISSWNKPEMSTGANHHEMDQNHAYNPAQSINGKTSHASHPDQSEMFTDSNRHELGDTKMSATLKGPWSIDGRAELEGYDRKLRAKPVIQRIPIGQ